MDPDAAHALELTGRDLMMLRAGLRAYLDAFDQHRRADGGATHPDADGAIDRA